MKIPSFFRQKFTLLATILTVLINGLLWAFLLFRFQPQLEPLFLHYNIYFGVDRIGPWWHIFFPAATGTVVFLLNTILGALLFERDRMMTYFLVSTSFFVQFILMGAAFLIALIN